MGCSAGDVATALRDAAGVIAAHRDELVSLDRAIGDGDHGENMKRGFTAIVSKLDTSTPDSPGSVLKLAATTLGDLQYTYDTAGNRIQVGGTWARTGLPLAVASATYNANNQQLTLGSRNLTYDLNGNLTNDSVNGYTWNARGQLVTIAGPVAAGFGYDGLGRRWAKTVNATTSFLYDGLNPVQEQSGAAIANFVIGLALDEFFTRTDTAATQAYLSDALGSTLALTDSAGIVQATYTYEPFGTTTFTGTTGNSYDYTGRESDGTGLKYYRARYYHPLFQRFVSEDSSGFSGGLHAYAYVDNTPPNFVDPLGLDKEATRAGARIIKAGLWGMGRGALIGAIGGAPALSAPEGAIVGGLVGLSTGLLMGTLGEASGINALIDKAIGNVGPSPFRPGPFPMPQ